MRGRAVPVRGRWRDGVGVVGSGVVGTFHRVRGRRGQRQVHAGGPAGRPHRGRAHPGAWRDRHRRGSAEPSARRPHDRAGRPRRGAAARRAAGAGVEPGRRPGRSGPGPRRVGRRRVPRSGGRGLSHAGGGGPRPVGGGRRLGGRRGRGGCGVEGRDHPVPRAGKTGAVTVSSDDLAAVDPWRDVVDQPSAVRQLEAAARAPVHAYLLVGPAGAGKRALARGFAAELLAAGSTGEARDRHVRLALAEQHPDMRVVEPEGMTFRKGDAERMVRHATLAPVEGERKVVVALGCEEIEDEAAGYLLKIVEEPPASTVFVLLATEVLPELVTIASRCAGVELGPLAATSIAARLVTEGVSPDRAEAAAAAAAGDLERARTLANDDRLVLRHRAWREAPRRLDGTGYRAAAVGAELQSMIAEAP